MKKEELTEEMKWFCNYYEKTLNDTQCRIWFDVFSKNNKAHFHENLMKHIKKSQNPFFPALGEIASMFKANWELS